MNKKELLKKCSPALADKITLSEQKIKQAIKQYNPCVHLVGFSGGGDSLTVCHLMQSLGFYFTAFHCNTGIGIEETRQFVRKTCYNNGWKLFEQMPTDKTYHELVLEMGFPGPSQHLQMYAYLKERAIRQILRYYPKKQDKMIVTGVRTNESGRRKINATKYIDRRGRQLWVSPILHWGDDDKDEFLDIVNADTNPVSKCLGMSGECLCGAFAKKGELKRIKQHYPKAAEQIEELERMVFEKGFSWGWNDSPPTGKKYIEAMEKVYSGYTEKYLNRKQEKQFKKTKQLSLFGLCQQCEVKHEIETQRSSRTNSDPTT